MDSDMRIQFAGVAVAATFAVASLVAAVGGLEAGWLDRFSGWILGGFLAVTLVVMVVLVGGTILILVFVVAIPRLVDLLRNQDDAPVILPALLTCLSAVLVGSAQDVLPDKPQLRWSLATLTATLTLARANYFPTFGFVVPLRSRVWWRWCRQSSYLLSPRLERRGWRDTAGSPSVRPDAPLGQVWVLFSVAGALVCAGLVGWHRSRTSNDIAG